MSPPVSPPHTPHPTSSVPVQSEGEEAMVSAALMALEVPPEAYHLGRTRVFFKTGQLAYVRKILDVRGLSPIWFLVETAWAGAVVCTV